MNIDQEQAVMACIAEALVCDDLKPTQDLRRDLYASDQGMAILTQFLNELGLNITLTQVQACATVADVMGLVK